MKQEDRLLTNDEMIVVLKSVPVIYRDSDLEILRVHLEAQDAKSIKLRDKEWIEVINEQQMYHDQCAEAKRYVKDEIPEVELHEGISNILKVIKSKMGEK